MSSLINKRTYKVLHEGLTPMGIVVSHKPIQVGDEIAYGTNRLKVVAGNNSEIVVTKIDNINIVELYDMKMNKVEFNY